MMKEQSFEDKIQELEKIVGELEKGDVSLEELIKKFENGIKLSKECTKILEDTEKKITVLLNDDDEVVEEEFKTETE